MADTREDFSSLFESSFQSILPMFGVKELKDEQKAALFYVLSGKEGFVSKAKWKSSNCNRVGDFTVSVFD